MCLVHQALINRKQVQKGFAWTNISVSDVLDQVEEKRKTKPTTTLVQPSQEAPSSIGSNRVLDSLRPRSTQSALSYDSEHSSSSSSVSSFRAPARPIAATVTRHVSITRSVNSVVQLNESPIELQTAPVQAQQSRKKRGRPLGSKNRK